MNILERFFYHEQRGEYDQALPIIEHLVSLHPHIATNWYNYGDCLEKLGRHEDAATAFLRVVDIEPEDGGAYYRACLALVAARDTVRLLAVVRRICTADPGMLLQIQSEPEFAPYFKLPEFSKLSQEFRAME